MNQVKVWATGLDCRLLGLLSFFLSCFLFFLFPCIGIGIGRRVGSPAFAGVGRRITGGRGFLFLAAAFCGTAAAARITTTFTAGRRLGVRTPCSAL